jgi:hypothetical protein
MNKFLNARLRAKVIQWVAALVVLSAIALALYGLSKTITGPYGTPIVAGIVGLLSFLFTKTFEFQKQREAAIAEKKREVYRRLLAPWIRVLVETKAGKAGDDLLSKVDLGELYTSSFDAALYGSEEVVKRYVDFRSPDTERDPMDMLRSLAALVIAMRQDVTGQKPKLSEEVVLRTFVTFKPEELVILRLREYVAKNPEAQKKLAEITNQTKPASKDTEAKGTIAG